MKYHAKILDKKCDKNEKKKVQYILKNKGTTMYILRVQ